MDNNNDRTRRLDQATRIITSRSQSTYERYGLNVPEEIRQQDREFAENIATIYGFREPEYVPVQLPPIVPTFLRALAIMIGLECLAALIALGMWLILK